LHSTLKILSAGFEAMVASQGDRLQKSLPRKSFHHIHTPTRPVGEHPVHHWWQAWFSLRPTQEYLENYPQSADSAAD
jgi:hypothetical protein